MKRTNGWLSLHSPQNTSCLSLLIPFFYASIPFSSSGFPFSTSFLSISLFVPLFKDSIFLHRLSTFSPGFCVWF